MLHHSCGDQAVLQPPPWGKASSCYPQSYSALSAIKYYNTCWNGRERNPAGAVTHGDKRFTDVPNKQALQADEVTPMLELLHSPLKLPVPADFITVCCHIKQPVPNILPSLLNHYLFTERMKRRVMNGALVNGEAGNS